MQARASDIIGRMERRIYVEALKSVQKSRRSLAAEPRGSATRAARYAFVFLSLNGPTMYLATANELIASINKPSACNPAVVKAAERIRARFGVAQARRKRSL